MFLIPRSIIKYDWVRDGLHSNTLLSFFLTQFSQFTNHNFILSLLQKLGFNFHLFSFASRISLNSTCNGQRQVYLNHIRTATLCLISLFIAAELIVEYLFNLFFNLFQTILVLVEILIHYSFDYLKTLKILNYDVIILIFEFLGFVCIMLVYYIIF